MHSKLHPAQHCRVLPPGEFDGMIVPFQVCSESFITTALTVSSERYAVRSAIEIASPSDCLSVRPSVRDAFELRENIYSEIYLHHLIALGCEKMPRKKCNRFSPGVVM